MATPVEPDLEIVLTDTVVATANYAYLPFEVLSGVTCLDVSMSTDRGAFLGIGLSTGAVTTINLPVFEVSPGPSGSSSSSPWMERPWVSSRPDRGGQLDGDDPGLPRGAADSGHRAGAHDTRPAVPPLLPGRLGVVREAPGWYRGDLHCHTEASTDAWATGTSLTPRRWAHDAARAKGLDFLAMTDHNVISQNWALRRDAGDGALLIAGEEMTNYFHGHATVTASSRAMAGLRQSLMGLPLPTGGARITEFFWSLEPWARTCPRHIRSFPRCPGSSSSTELSTLQRARTASRCGMVPGR